MRVVADTSVLVSALLWQGVPHRLLTAAEAGRVALYTSPTLLDELAGVLAREKFAARVTRLRTTVNELITGYVKIAHLVLPAPIPPVVIEDPTDDAVLACALTAQAQYLVSGDAHLLSLKRHQTVEIVAPRAFVEILRSSH